MTAAPSTAADPAPAGRLRFLRSGYPRSFAIGSTFSIAWSPCIGPILGAVMTLAATTGAASQGALLLAFYALGLGVWFLAFGAFFSWLTPRMRRIQPYMPRLLVGSGVLFIGVGALMVLGEFARLNAYFQSFGFLFNQTSSAEQGLSGGVDGLLGPAIAFFGGVISFLSPCVLPMVPVYLANLAGEAVAGAGAGAGARRRVFMHAVAFVAGFTLVFAVIGASAGLLGNVLQEHLDTMTRVGGAIMVVFGMQISGLIHIPYLERTYQLPAPR